MYILHCSDGSYYTGSTKDLELRLEQHMLGQGANYTRKRLPVKLLYFEEYQRIDEAYYREKQVQGWNRKKKEALIDGKPELLPELAIAYRDRNTSESLKPQSRPEGLEGQSSEAESNQPEPPFGFESTYGFENPSTGLRNHLSQPVNLSRRDALDSDHYEPQSHSMKPEPRPEEFPERRLRLSKASRRVLEGQPNEADISSEPDHPFGFECLSRRDALESQPHEAQWPNSHPNKPTSKSNQ
ncbi:MAG: GIY-YIG nuclease family protein [Cryomorphaceae bacterium]|nr:MAG: GIY-YIG nuclease family protein [Cryomorphaceae bacterium]